MESLGAIATGGRPPAEFVRLVRDALAHLYDPAHLLRQPLGGLLADSLPRHGDPAQGLRDLILDEIEALEPPAGGLGDERSRRPHLVLTHRYVDGYATEDIIGRLHISPRQFQREHRKGLHALAVRLWGRCRSRADLSAASEADEAAGLQAEVDSLGVELEVAAVAGLLESIRAPATALAGRYGVDLRLPAEPPEHRCTCDRTLAKQGLLACLSGLLSQRPRLLEVAVAGHRRSPAIVMRVSPPLADAGLAGLQPELSACRTLMAAQGGSTQTLEEDGSLAGLRLLLPPESGAHILVVDDNEKMLQLYERYLAAGRYTLSTAISAPEAERLLGKVRPDAIVLDVMMREVDGWELLQRLRSRPELAAVPILVCSILDEPQLAYALGAQAHLRKPIAAEDLLAELERLLEESSPAAPRPAAP